MRSSKRKHSRSVKRGNVLINVTKRVEDDIRDYMGYQVANQVNRYVGNKVYRLLGEILWYPVSDQVKIQIMEQIFEEL